MNPEITKSIAALRMDEMHAAAAAARLARQARAGRAAALPPPGFTAASGWNTRLERLLGRWAPWPRPEQLAGINVAGMRR